MGDETVHKGYHCAWQIHYHIVFPVKYRKAILDTEVTNIIIETAEAITERYAIEMEAIGANSLFYTTEQLIPARTDERPPSCLSLEILQPIL